jgi:hypothetical protein
MIDTDSFYSSYSSKSLKISSFLNKIQNNRLVLISVTLRAQRRGEAISELRARDWPQPSALLPKARNSVQSRSKNPVNGIKLLNQDS